METKQLTLKQQVTVMRKALNDISHAAYTCANGGLKVPGKSDKISDIKRHMRGIRDVANEALAETA